MKKTVILSLIFATFVQAADILISSRGPYQDLARGAAWGQRGRNGVENNYILQPLNPAQGICLFIANNNPVSAHTFTLEVHQTGDVMQTVYEGQTGRWVADTVQGLPIPATVAAGSMVSAYVHTSAAARIAVSISGTTAQTGSPDTADIFLVQTEASSCGPVQGGSSSIQGWAPNGSYWDDSSNPVVVAGLNASNQINILPVTSLGVSTTVNRLPACGGVNGYQAISLQQLPISSTQVYSEPPCIISIYLWNNNSSDATVTLIGGTTSVPVFSGLTVPAKTLVSVSDANIALGEPLRWYASTTGVYGSLLLGRLP